MKALLLFALSSLSCVAWSDVPCTSLAANEAEDTFCSQTASALRVQLHALKILRKHDGADNSEAIHYLESQAGLYRKSLAVYSGRAACKTGNVDSVTAEANAYWQAYGLDRTPN